MLTNEELDMIIALLTSKDISFSGDMKRKWLEIEDKILAMKDSNVVRIPRRDEA